MQTAVDRGHILSVKIKNISCTKFQFVHVKVGNNVPPGSRLGPLLFALKHDTSVQCHQEM